MKVCTVWASMYCSAGKQQVQAASGLHLIGLQPYLLLAGITARMHGSGVNMLCAYC